MEKGYARTTARDIAAASGVSLAAIGYHFGSKDALLVKAYVSLIEGLGETFDPGWGAGDVTTPARSLERFQEVWANIIRSLPESRSVWMLSLEIIVNGDRLQDVRKLLAEAQEQGRSGIVPMFNGIPEDQLDKETVDTEGRFYQTLLNGLMVQWLFDPDSATGAEQLTEGLRRVLAGVELAEGETG